MTFPITDEDKVLINKTELDNILYKNAKALRSIGLEALLELYAQLSSAVASHAKSFQRARLPQHMHAIVNRYLQWRRR